MAEEVQKEVQQGVPLAEEVREVPDVQAAAVERELPPVPEEEAVKPKQEEQILKDSDKEKIPQSGFFKEESTRVADLSENEKKAFQEFKQLVQDALNKHEFSAGTTPLPQETAKEEEKKGEDQVVEEVGKAEAETEKEDNVAAEETEQPPAGETKTDVADDDGAKTVEAIEETVVAVSTSVQPEQPPAAEVKPDVGSSGESKTEKTEAQIPPEQVSIWGIPLLTDKRSDVILLKFLRARDFKVKDAFTMIKNTIRWRKEFGIDELIEQDLGLGDDLENVVFMHGVDKEGHPVCYNVYGEFRNKDLHRKIFSDEEKRLKFLRWRIQFLEKSIRKLGFSPGGISTFVQVNDLKNSPGWELRQTTKQALQLLQDNYPEFAAKQVFINVPWWYLAFNKMISPFLTQRTRSKFVFAGPSKSVETLLRYIAAEQVPVKYGGLSKEGEFATTDTVTEITVKPSSKHTVEFPLSETCLLTWELRVVGWEVSYGAEFVPTAEDSYTVIIQKTRKVGAGEEPVVCSSFKSGEPGKVVITIGNPTSQKKKFLYRLKTKPTTD
ncbi:hypothetical protein SLE2022_375450 [Rubroshorea leprosula]